MPHALPQWLALLAPLALLAVGGLAPVLGDARRVRTAALGAAMLAAGCAALAALALALGGRALPGTLSHLDAVSATMLVLVASVGLAVVAYSRRYLDADPGEARFHRWLCLTLAAVLVLVQAGNLAILAAAWVATSLSLHQLLLFFPERPGARLAARKKFVTSRAGDLCLLLALAVAWPTFGGLDLSTISASAAAMRESGAAAPFGAHAVAVLLALAAILKSAQVPFHGWLPEVMETPTPVSALLHAGVVNAGGYLLVRNAEVVALSVGALDLLLVVGAATATIGAAVMLTQTSAKVALAWSTVAQMGFMVMQCGLGAFAAALLHIVAHSVYKAHAFLTAGGAARRRRPDPPPPLPMAVLIPALAASVAISLAAGAALGMSFAESPGVGVLGAVLTMGLAPTLAAAVAERRTPFVAARAVGIAAAVAVAYFGLQAGAAWLFGAALPPGTAPRGLLTPVLAALVVAAFAALLVLNVARRAPDAPGWLRALHVHLLNGLYLNHLAGRALARLWPVAGERSARP